MQVDHPKERADFWWLPPNLDDLTLLVGVGHHRLLTDDDDPMKLSWFRPLEVSTEPKNNPYLHCLTFLDRWRKDCGNINVYRTLRLFSKESQEESVFGPFLIDIDNGEEDLADALYITRQVVEYLMNTWHLDKEKFRIFFSGRKGFNVEVCSSTLIEDYLDANLLPVFGRKLDEIILWLRTKNGISGGCINTVSAHGTAIDRIYGGIRNSGYYLKHPYVRLHRSVNSWIGADSAIIKRMKLEWNLDDLNNALIENIRLESERMASNPVREF